MHSKFANFLKATIIDIIVALFVLCTIVFVIRLIFGAKIDETISIVSKISISTDQKEIKPIEFENKKLKNYPEYGTQYATIQIPSINVDVPVYFGDTLEILKKGVGHSSGSYFPGEGGSIIYMGHNSKNMFRRFSEVKKGDKITVKTSYGEFNYKIYDMQLIKETETDKLPIQDQKEILMVYTCYPFNNIGYATQRYVLYAELENGGEN
jgi:sortase A